MPLPIPRSADGRFRNWSRTVTGPPASWRAPSTQGEVVAAVRAAGGRSLKVVGGGHSWSGAAVPEQHALTLDRYAGLVSVEDGRARVRAGTRLRDLSAALATRGLSLPVLGSIQQQSLGGAVATGTHGSSLVHGNLASLVHAMRVVTGTGDVVELEGDRAAAARVHLGVLGVVTELTVDVAPAFVLRQTIEQREPQQAAADLEQIARSAEYVKVWWLPGARHAQVIRYERTTERPTRGPVVRRAVDEKALHRWVFPALTGVQHRRPELVPRINDRLSRTYLGPRVQVGAMPLMLNTPLPLRHRETEAALPLRKAGERLGQLVDVLRRDALGANFPVEVRFVREDDAWLSPAYGEDACQIGCYSTGGPRCDDLFAAFWDVMRDARPHWGKELRHTHEDLRALYPRWSGFQGLRDELDPHRLFRNAFTTSVLGA